MIDSLIDIFRMTEISPETRAKIIKKLGPAINHSLAMNITEDLVEELLEALQPPQVTDEQHPNQPMVDDHGVTRWKANAIVRYLLDYNGKLHLDLNELATLGFSDEDFRQFAQLIGYSVSGWGSLSYVPLELAQAADEQAERFSAALQGDDNGNTP